MTNPRSMLAEELHQIADLIENGAVCSVLYAFYDEAGSAHCGYLDPSQRCQNLLVHLRDLEMLVDQVYRETSPRPAVDMRGRTSLTETRLERIARQIRELDRQLDVIGQDMEAEGT